MKPFSENKKQLCVVLADLKPQKNQNQNALHQINE